MEKYLKLFFIALFATMSFSLTSCGDDDEDGPEMPTESFGTFNVNGRDLYLVPAEEYTFPKCGEIANAILADSKLIGNPTLPREMQISFDLLKSPKLLELVVVTEVGIRVEPFDVTTISKGAKLKIIESRHDSFTVINLKDNHWGFDYTNDKVYYISDSGSSVVFEGYDSATNIATISINATATSDDSETIKLHGTVLCDYGDHFFVGP